MNANEVKTFKNNAVFILVEDDGSEIECNPTVFNDGDNKYVYFQMNEGNFNECFFVSILDIDGIKKMKLITGEEFKILEKVYLYHPYTADYYPVEINEEAFMRGYYKDNSSY